MEHRWGIRRTLDVGVVLCSQRGRPMSGRLLNASSSGGYVATDALLPIMARVHVTLGWGGPMSGDDRRFTAYVVRLDAHGIGLEWQEFAPAPLLALLNAPPRQQNLALYRPTGLPSMANGYWADALR